MTKINLTIEELSKMVEGESSLSRSFLVKKVASLENAQEGDLAVLFDPEENSPFAPLSIEKIKSSKAGVILASRPVVEGKNYLIVKNPLAALEKISWFIKTRKSKVDESISSKSCVGEFAVLEDEVCVGPYAVIEDDAKIGYGAQIGANVFVGRGAQIGCEAIIHPGAKILDRCVIGDGSIIHAGAVIGSDGFGYRIMKNGMHKIAHVGIVNIGKMVEIGANTTIDRALFGETKIGDGTKIDNCVHIAHNVEIGASTAILAHTGIAGSVKIGIGCQIGGQVAIKDHVTIGNGVKIVSKSAVMRNLEDGAIVCGIPSMPFSSWKRMMVAMTKLPEIYKQLKNMKKGFWARLFGG